MRRQYVGRTLCAGERCLRTSPAPNLLDHLRQSTCFALMKQATALTLPTPSHHDAQRGHAVFERREALIHTTAPPSGQGLCFVLTR